ncbi:MAG TPA: hypothetical protein VK425_12765 [Acidimicrobiales bacterium]|nr:hypothetical protein [Acidimicrobiales bacterium]
MSIGMARIGFKAFHAATALACAAATLVAGPLGAVSYAQPTRPAPALVPASSNPGTQLQQIAASAKGESKATFKLTYTSKSSGSSASQVTLEQKPPDQLFRSGTGEVLYNGKKTYYCSTEGPAPTCLVYGAPGQSPLASMMEIYSAAPYVTIMQGWGELIAARVLGYRISFSRASFAGQHSECVTWSYHGSMTEYCVTDKGILAYVGGSGSGSSSSFELTAYSGHVNRSDFNLPQGAKIMSYP